MQRRRRIRENSSFGDENPLRGLRSNILEFPNGEYIYIEYENGSLIGGSATNTGIIPEFTMDYDFDESVDRNLENFYDMIMKESGERFMESRKTRARKKRAIAESEKRNIRSRARKPKKNLKESMTDDIKLFMNTWANYNENGAGGGITPTGWMSVDEAEEYAEEYKEFEPFINDTDNLPRGLAEQITEYTNVDTAIEMIRDFENACNSYDETLINAVLEACDDFDEAVSVLDSGDFFFIGADNDTDLAYEVVDKMYGGVEQLDRETLERYFDYEAYGRDLSYDYVAVSDGYVCIH